MNSRVVLYLLVFFPLLTMASWPPLTCDRGTEFLPRHLISGAVREPKFENPSNVTYEPQAQPQRLIDPFYRDTHPFLYDDLGRVLRPDVTMTVALESYEKAKTSASFHCGTVFVPGSIDFLSGFVSGFCPHVYDQVDAACFIHDTCYDVDPMPVERKTFCDRLFCNHLARISDQSWGCQWATAAMCQAVELFPYAMFDARMREEP
ncbi:unnamed protein product, partial [Mesorhabditis spiculigera]